MPLSDKIVNDIFSQCQAIVSLLNNNQEAEARQQTIILLDYHQKNGISELSPLCNSILRQTGLYPYMEEQTSTFSDRLLMNCFKVDAGYQEDVVLHRDQFLLLRKLLEGKDIAVSAPTSFGKSFVIDSFIRIKKPSNVMIIVPTIALTDETRRRIYKKFATEYKVITTTDTEPSERNIFIFPQERALSWVEKIDNLDILIIDEFYKASAQLNNDERVPALVKAIIKIGSKAKQRYFLAPNISSLEDNPFTKGMEFLRLDFSTVFLNKTDYSKEIGKDEKKKGETLLSLNNRLPGKTLIFAGTHSQVEKVSTLLSANTREIDSELLVSFSEWLGKNYEYNWRLPILAKRGIGIHTGQLHRSLSQIQVKLFEEERGLSRLVSTSSIIEGVNTSAENVIVWTTSTRGFSLDSFSYKNVIGRAGRMFRHFVGNIHVLQEAPDEAPVNLNIELPEQVVGEIDHDKYAGYLSEEQIRAIKQQEAEMTDLLGGELYTKIKTGEGFQTSNSTAMRGIAVEMKEKPEKWDKMSFLAYSPDYWDNALYKLLYTRPGWWDSSYSKFVAFVKVLSQNWERTIPELLYELEKDDIGIDEFFKLERTVTFKLGSLLHDVDMLQKSILPQAGFDISGFAYNVAHAFLPAAVYELEEYGLPRMISRKIQNAGFINFNSPDLTFEKSIQIMREIGPQKIKGIETIDAFDKYIIDYFFEGLNVRAQ